MADFGAQGGAEKESCFFPPNRECPADCPGVRDARLIGEYSVELCQNPRMQGNTPFVYDPEDDGPMIVTLYIGSELPPFLIAGDRHQPSFEDWERIGGMNPVEDQWGELSELGRVVEGTRLSYVARFLRRTQEITANTRDSMDEVFGLAYAGLGDVQRKAEASIDELWERHGINATDDLVE